MKRYIAWLLAFATVLVAASENGSSERQFLRATEAFDHAHAPADYRHAAELFEALLQDGYQNGAVYYDLGNAWMKAGENGRAIAAYRKALPFRPRDPYLLANLSHALATAPGRLPAAALQPWWRQIFFWKDWLSLPEKFQFAAAAAVAAFLLAMAALQWPGARRGLNRAALAGVGVALLLGTGAGIAWSEAVHSRHAVVVKETLARKGNSTDYQPAFDQPLKDGAEFTVLEHRGEWVFGHFEGAGDAWVPRDAVVE